MNKTILKMDKELSIIVLSGIAMLGVFLSEYSSITHFISFFFILAKCSIFIGIPFMVYVKEKNNVDFKKVAGIYSGYFILNFLVTIIVSLSTVKGEASSFFRFLFDGINLLILLCSVMIMIEQLLEYNGINNKIYKKTVMKIVYVISNFVSYPFIALINRKKNKNEE